MSDHGGELNELIVYVSRGMINNSNDNDNDNDNGNVHNELVVNPVDPQSFPISVIPSHGFQYFASFLSILLHLKIPYSSSRPLPSFHSQIYPVLFSRLGQEKELFISLLEKSKMLLTIYLSKTPTISQKNRELCFLIYAYVFHSIFDFFQLLERGTKKI
ncbi:hypothetical protein EYC80_006598 [Monilinia laxa]|uniref:Uncharacterized protein n=1 Tax=Monilinia laxa TaxID=61186 RepID=A0A5N6JSF7_MONLA|nr:hypothetical protein EYC80_006598 [Monilinia laxa]